MRHTLLLVLLLNTVSMVAQMPADRILGIYRAVSPIDGDTADIQVSRAADNTYQGRVVWASRRTNPDGSVRTDCNNANPALRSRRYDQVILCWDLRYKDGEWVKGKLYEPTTGKTFSVKMKLAANGRDLEARYYKGVPAVGISCTWQRQND
ncbi:MAG: DUF2147 domain-containing protein [Bacteroidales bacterium]|nr:DUF2147 domain-containing protein [Bacteroidales bacterium]